MPVFSGIGYRTSPYSANFVVGGNMMGEWMAKEIGGKGNVLIVEGYPGHLGLRTGRHPRL
ncbi:MAG: hypothetical protein HYX36_06595 [Rhizobiales bacterium]|nr:hypothetical protein [Hyphomicrobiales bacterium]